eukprot:gene5890-9076_t
MEEATVEHEIQEEDQNNHPHDTYTASACMLYEPSKPLKSLSSISSLSTSRTKQTGIHSPKKRLHNRLDPDLLFPDIPRERNSPLPSLSQKPEGDRDDAYDSLSPHPVLPFIYDAEKHSSNYEDTESVEDALLSAIRKRNPRPSSAVSFPQEHKPDEEAYTHSAKEMTLYLEEAGVRTTIKKLVEQLFLERPDNPVEFMIQMLNQPDDTSDLQGKLTSKKSPLLDEL